MRYKKNKGRLVDLKHFLTAPIIDSMLVPLFFTDICCEIYHRLCFPVYNLPYIKRQNYIKIDRHRLSYLSGFDKMNCAYCGYANGLAGYWTKIAGETEKYWCGIKHNNSKGFVEPEHHKGFYEYGDDSKFRKRLCK